jgi:dienelactone hydrolase
MRPVPLAGFEESSFQHDGKSRPLFRRGRGPGVVIVHEVPGITPAVAEFGRRVADAGFSAVLPQLFGTPGKDYSAGYILEGLARACISREFHVLAARRSSPIMDWLRALCRSVHAECGGPGVGFVGMCLTGNFALAAMLDEAVMAPVLSQPSLPFPLTSAQRHGLHVSDEELAAVRKRAAAGCGVLGLRFTGDPMVPAARFERLRRELGPGFEAIEIDSTPGNAHGIPRTAHSVLTKDLVDREGHPTRAALDRVLALFRERLAPAS